MINVKPIACAALLLTGVASADRLDINLSEHAAGGEWVTSRLSRELQLSLGAVHHEDKGDVAWAGVQVEQRQGNFRALIGARGYYIDTPWREWSDALALGGGVVVSLLGDERLTAGAELWYAPSITSGRGADQLSHATIQLGAKVMDNARVTVGWREVRTEYKYSDYAHTIDRGLNLGVSLLF